MKVDLTELLNGNEDQLTFQEKIIPDDEEIKNVGFKTWGPIEAKGTIFRANHELILNLELAFDYETECDRCLKGVENHIEDTYTFIMQEKKDFDEFSEENEDVDIALYEDLYYNSKDDIMDSAYLALPNKILCTDDCKGLCPHCGIDLNESTCNCEENQIDPRMEVLKDLLNND